MNWIQLLIILLVVLGPAAQAIWKKLQEQRAIKAAEDAAAKRREDMLRTGRDPEAEAAARQAAEMARVEAEQAELRRAEAARQLEMRQRRQEQLRELRRQRGATGSAGGAGGGGASVGEMFEQGGIGGGAAGGAGPVRKTQRELWPGGPKVVVTEMVGERGRGAGETEAKKQSRQQRQRSERQQPMSGRERVGMSAEAFAAEAREEDDSSARRAATILRLSAASDAAPGQRPASGPRVELLDQLKLRSPADWRRAIIASEILKEPLSIRQD